MNLNSDISLLFNNNNHLITTSQFTELGYSKTLLGQYVKAGLIERVGHGIYTLKDEIVDDMYLLMLKSEKIIFSHETALFLNSLSERTPFLHTVTIPSNSVLSKSAREDCKCYYIKPELYKIGVVDRMTTFGNIVRCYNSERTICDIIRSRSNIDEETLISSIKMYATSKNKDLNLLGEYAKIFKVQKILKGYLEVLL